MQAQDIPEKELIIANSERLTSYSFDSLTRRQASTTLNQAAGTVPGTLATARKRIEESHADLSPGQRNGLAPASQVRPNVLTAQDSSGHRHDKPAVTGLLGPCLLLLASFLLGLAGYFSAGRLAPPRTVQVDAVKPYDNAFIKDTPAPMPAPAPMPVAEPEVKAMDAQPPATEPHAIAEPATQAPLELPQEKPADECSGAKRALQLCAAAG